MFSFMKNAHWNVKAKGVIASEGRDIEMITTDAGTTQYRTLKKQFSRR
jgi:hypothetical protein